MKKKYLIILIVLIIVLISVCTIKISKTNSNKETNTSRNFILTDNTTTKVNTNGENAGIYVGVTENDKNNYLFLSIKIDKSKSKEEQAKSLISAISDAIGYKIDINSIKISENTIKIDFAKTSAPFEVETSYIPEASKKYFITNSNVVPKTIFDSLNKTLKSYFGSETEIYFSADSENINIVNEIMTINIEANKPY